MKYEPKPNAFTIPVRVYYEDTDAGDIVSCLERVAVRPAQSFAQREAVFEAIRGHGPACRGGRHW